MWAQLAEPSTLVLSASMPCLRRWLPMSSSRRICGWLFLRPSARHGSRAMSTVACRLRFWPQASCCQSGRYCCLRGPTHASMHRITAPRVDELQHDRMTFGDPVSLAPDQKLTVEPSIQVLSVVQHRPVAAGLSPNL